jgi:hypothetical protein
MSFQWIIDRAESISIDRQDIVGQTITRNQTVRAVSRGAGVWKFTVKVPDGISWSELRPYISPSEKLGKTTVAPISINAAGHTWISQYQGNSANSTGFVATITKGSATITLTTSPTTSSGYKFRAGDFIQLGTTGRVYTVAADVAFNSNTVTLHRAVIENSATSVALRVGPNCTWNVICTEFPQWQLFARDQVSWTGAFVFYESMV